MASWSEVEAEAPELAKRAKGLFDAHIHKTMATIRKDGSPRISGTEVEFSDGELYIGSMWKAVKALDLRRDPRFAIHSGSGDPGEGWEADAKLAGTMEEIEGGGSGEERSHRFRADITELVVTGLNDERTKLEVESWHEGRGLDRLER